MTSVAVIGCGYWGKNLARNFSQEKVLKAVVDVSPQTAEQIANSYQVPAMSLTQVLNNPDIASVAVAVPAREHYQVVKAALKAGKNVFVEKPLAFKSIEAEDLMQLATVEQKILMVGHVLQYHPAYERLKEIVKDLGPIRRILFQRNSFGKIRPQEDVLWDFGPHDLSMVLGVLENVSLDAAQAIGIAHLHPDHIDTVMVQLRFNQTIHVQGMLSWMSPIKQQQFIVITDAGSVIFDDTLDWDHKLCLINAQISMPHGFPQLLGGSPAYVSLAPAEPLKQECLHFLESIATGRQPRTNAHEALRVTKVLETLALNMQQRA